MKTNLASPITGRIREKNILKQFLTSSKAEFMALYGRRRIGKTYLIKNFFSQESCVFFHTAGIQGGRIAEQLEQFSKQIGATFYGGASIASCRRWLDSFEELTKAINQIPSGKKIVIFFDEFPWMATRRSGLVQALDYYWNRYWVHVNRIKLIICGSSASWIIEKIINDKGGLYNRVTRTMQLDSFTLSETQALLNYMKIKLSPRQILDLYMVLGGVPHYLALIRKGLSAYQCLDELCFQKDGPLVNEFDRLFASLFNESKLYADLVKIIAKYRYGIGQAQLINESTLSSDGGRVVHRLKELEDSGFILSFIPYGHSDKGIYYRIVDEFILFYLYWIKPNLTTIRKHDRTPGYWLAKSQSPSWKSWAGYAFEAICYKHLVQIRKALSIDAGATVGSWRYAPRINKESGAQIDLLFDRSDDTITISEIKYNEKPFVIDKAYAAILRNKIEVFRKITKTQKQIFLAFITISGLKPTVYSEDMITQVLTLTDLFNE